MSNMHLIGLGKISSFLSRIFMFEELALFGGESIHNRQGCGSTTGIFLRAQLKAGTWF
jgi:hypothetical protein